MDKSKIQGLLFYYKSAANIDEGIRTQTIEVLEGVIEKLEADEAAAAKKRKSPNKSGIVQIDAETGKIIAEFDTQKDATAAIGKEGKSGISDAINGRVSTHKYAGFRWYFKDELAAAKAAGHLK